MSEFFSFLKVFIGCSTVLFMVMLVLLALPQSRLRCVGLEMTKWLLAAGMAVLVASPADLIPFLPVDDIGYVIAGICAAKSALGERQKRLLYEEVELAELRDQVSNNATLEAESQS